jgi:ASC-1-like (ASCH) protein
MEEDGVIDQVKNEKRLQYMLDNPQALQAYFQEWMENHHTTGDEGPQDELATMENLFTLLKVHVTEDKQPPHTFLDTKKNHTFLQIAQEAEATITKWKVQEEDYKQTLHTLIEQAAEATITKWKGHEEDYDQAQQVIANQELLENEREFNKFLQALMEEIEHLQGKIIPTHLLPVLKADLQVLYVNHCVVLKQHYNSFLEVYKDKSIEEINTQAEKTRNTLNEAEQEAEPTITNWRIPDEEYAQAQQVIINQELLENETEFNKFLQSLIEGIAYLQGKKIPTHLLPGLKADLHVLYVNHCLVLMQHYNSFLEVYKDKSMEEINTQAEKTRNNLKEAGIYDPTEDLDAGAI